MQVPGRRPVLAITGATGFLGGHVLAQALAKGCTVRALIRKSQSERDGVTWVSGDLSNPAALTELCQGADAVIHVAGVVNAPDVADFMQGNVAGTQAVVDAAAAAKVQRFVHVSSLSAREPLLSRYGASKAAAEDIVTASGLDWTIVRPPGIYGPGDGEMLDLFKMARLGFVLLPPDGRGSWIFAEDLAALLVALALSLTAGRSAILEPDDGAAKGWSHRELGRLIGKAVGREVLTLSAPPALLNLAATGDRLVRGDRAKLTRDRIGYMCHPDWTVDPARQPDSTFWTPQTSLAEGLAQTADWYREQGWL